MKPKGSLKPDQYLKILSASKILQVYDRGVKAAGIVDKIIIN
mgnify:CR=1 FL=1